MNSMKDLIIALVALAGCGGVHTVGGKTSADVFSSGAQVQLADTSCVGDKDAIYEAIALGADVNHAGFGGTTPLMWAITCQSERGISALLNKGANPNKYIDGSVNPIVISSTYDNSNLLRILLEGGGDANSIDKRDGRRAVDLAFLKGVEDSDWTNFNQLISKGARVDIEDQMGSTSVEYFAKLNRFDVVNKMLINHNYRHNLKKLRAIAHSAIIDPESHLFKERISTLRILHRIYQ
ncbi:hypothetical protein J3454_12760 [Erythrobacter sp. NFXS35]|uniref:ankyrin repeat domain-containing protein n=1 Tax=Erythrobacter sp. NFXS35 TaxID=2818436 RepID=UPI0032DFFE5E